jgi:hypothetical protein
MRGPLLPLVFTFDRVAAACPGIPARRVSSFSPIGRVKVVGSIFGW